MLNMHSMTKMNSINMSSIAQMDPCYTKLEHLDRFVIVSSSPNHLFVNYFYFKKL